MTTLQPLRRKLSLEEQILALSDYAVRKKIPVKLRETGLFDEDEIERAVIWLIDFRQSHHLDVIE